MTDYIKTENWKMKGTKNHNTLVEFMHDYMQNHVYCSRVFLSGLYVSKIYPNKPNDYKKREASIKRKVGVIFRILARYDLVSRFNTTTIRVHEKFKEKSLDDILELIENNS